MPIRYKLLIIFLLISLFPAGVLALFSYLNAKDALKNSTVEGLRVISEFREAEVFHFIDSQKTVTKNYASDGYIREHLSIIQQGNANARQAVVRLNSHLRNNKLPINKVIMSIDVISLDGRIAASTEPSRVGQITSDIAYFENGITTSYVSNIHAHHDNDFELDVATPIFRQGAGGQPIGVLINHFSIEGLNSLLRGDFVIKLGAKTQVRGVGKTGESYLVNQSGHMMTESIFPDNPKHYMKVDTFPVRMGLNSRQEVTGMWTNYREVPVVGASMVIEVDGFFVVLISEQEQTEAFAVVHRVQKGILIIFLIMLVVVIFVAIFTSQGITRPLQKLMVSMEFIRKGNLDAQVSGIESKDEIGFLAHTFNHMQNDLKLAKNSLEEQNRKLAELSTKDGLTGLYNRRYLDQVISAEFNRALRYNTPLSVMILDLDHFKLVNDTHGHLFGDHVLRESAQLLTAGLRKTDIIGRYGGEEFLVISPNTSLENIQLLAHKLCKQFAAHEFTVGGHTHKLTISIGMAPCNAEMTKHEELIHASDTALYLAKQSGRDRVCLSDHTCLTDACLGSEQS